MTRTRPCLIPPPPAQRSERIEDSPWVFERFTKTGGVVLKHRDTAQRTFWGRNDYALYTVILFGLKYAFVKALQPAPTASPVQQQRFAALKRKASVQTRLGGHRLRWFPAKQTDKGFWWMVGLCTHCSRTVILQPESLFNTSPITGDALSHDCDA